MEEAGNIKLMRPETLGEDELSFPRVDPRDRRAVNENSALISVLQQRQPPSQTHFPALSHTYFFSEWLNCT